MPLLYSLPFSLPNLSPIQFCLVCRCKYLLWCCSLHIVTGHFIASFLIHIVFFLLKDIAKHIIFLITNQQFNSAQTSKCYLKSLQFVVQFNFVFGRHYEASQLACLVSLYFTCNHIFIITCHLSMTLHVCVCFEVGVSFFIHNCLGLLYVSYLPND